MAAPRFELRPVGIVAADPDGFALRIDPQFRDALMGLDGFSHLTVLWWCHLLAGPEYRSVLVAEQPYRDGPERLGVFATRSPARPNPLALTPVAVLSIDVEAGVVRIPFIDAEPGSPILDIKPYHPAVDRVRDVTVPTWCSHWPQWYEDSATFDWAAVLQHAS